MATSQRYALNKNKYLLDPEFERLELSLKKYRFKEPRNCLALSLACKTGARAQELLRIKKNDLNYYDRSVLIKGIKGSNDREIPLPKDLFEDLEDYSDKMKDFELIFPICYHRLRQIWLDYRPIPKKFHCLRHTFAIRLYKKTKDIRLLQVALGHRNITNTMVYADYIYSQSELKKLIL